MEGFRTSRVERYSFMLFMGGQAIFNQLLNSFGQKFMTELGISAAVVGTIFLATRIFDAVNDPVFGGIIDRANLKGGKFLPWLRISAILLPVITAIIFFMPSSLSGPAKILYATVFYVLYSVAYTICDVPIFSMISAITDSVQERVFIMSRNAIAAGAVLVVLAVAVPSLYPVIGWGPTGLILSVVGGLIMIPMGRKGKERFLNKDPEKVTIRIMADFLRRNKYLQLYFVGLLLLFSTATTQQVLPFFADFNLGDPGRYTTIALAIVLPPLIFVIILPMITKKVDKFHVFLVCIIGQLIVSAVSFFAGYGNAAVFYALMACRGFFWGGNVMMMTMFTSDFIEYGEFRTGKRLQGTTYSIQTFVCKVMTAVAGAFVMFVMSVAGFKAGTGVVQSAATLDAIWFLVSLMPVIGAALSLIFFLRYDLRDKDVQLMARANGGEITKEEAESGFSHPYK
jgi:probable glucitol transport protein GutA